MKVNLYSLYDVKSQTYHAPVVMANDEVALRSVRSLLADASTLMHQYPEDFSLRKVAEFDDVTGEVSPVVPPFKLVELSALVLKDGQRG